jgi:hypothetical protein
MSRTLKAMVWKERKEMDILISNCHAALLRDYSKKRGLSIDLCVHYALVDWFRNGAPVTLVRLGLPTRRE